MEVSGVNSSQYITGAAELKKNNTEVSDFESALKKAMDQKDDAALKKACQGFEGMFLKMIYKEMKASIPKSNLLEDSYGKEVFEGMLDDQIMDDASKTNSIGLADVLYKQLHKKIK